MLPGLRSMHPRAVSIAGHGPPDEPAPGLSVEAEAGVEPVAEALGILATRAVGTYPLMPSMTIRICCGASSRSYAGQNA